MPVIQNSPDGFFQANREALELSMHRAVQEALREHKAFGNPIAIWRDGKVVIIPPEEIPVDDPMSNSALRNQLDAEQRTK